MVLLPQGIEANHLLAVPTNFRRICGNRRRNQLRYGHSSRNRARYCLPLPRWRRPASAG